MQDGGSSSTASEGGDSLTVSGPSALGSQANAAAVAASQTPALPAPVDEGSSLLSGHDDDNGSELAPPARAANSHAGGKRCPSLCVGRRCALR